MTALKAPLTFLFLVATLGLMAGCQRVHIGDNDGGVMGSDGSVTADGSVTTDGGRDEPCGPTTCTGGQVCCNASCGVCTEPGGACTAIACTMNCAANNDCESTEYCSLSHCPDGTSDGVCVPRPSECTEEYAPVCGCDGATHSNECSANGAGVVAARIGECSAPPPTCAAQDIRAEGPCAAVIGVMWDGTSCRGLSGCSCVGADCDSIHRSVAACESANSGCHSCAAQEAAGEGPCDAEIGVFWNGTSCVSQSGCECVGADCTNGWFDIAACEAAHLHCGSTPTCTTNAECGMFEFCSRPEGVCSGTGTCERIPGPIACSPAATPVCGCDGVNYNCATEANIRGAVVAHEGECELACGPADVAGVGGCEVLLGHYWDGSSCQALSGCSCSGAGCGRLTSLEACQSAHAGCGGTGRSCGGFGALACGPSEFCDYPADDVCGGADSLGTCQPRPTACTFVLDPQCGCDGAAYDNTCFANMAGTDISGGLGCI